MAWRRGSSTASSIPAFKAALLAALQARSNLKGVQVTYGGPWPFPEPEWIWLAGVTGNQAAAAVGNQRREERYQLSILIRVTQTGNESAQPTTERCFALFNEIEQTLRADATVGGAVRESYPTGPIELGEDVTEDGSQWVSELLVTVEARKRISAV